MAKEKAAAPAVSANPTKVEFPRDQWGMTTDLRKYGLLAAGRVRGDQAKLDLFLATLRLLAQHAMARLPVDQEARSSRRAARDARDASVVQNNGHKPAQLPPASPVE